jgi:hypothetical protein
MNAKVFVRASLPTNRVTVAGRLQAPLWPKWASIVSLCGPSGDLIALDPARGAADAAPSQAKLSERAESWNSCEAGCRPGATGTYIPDAARHEL